ncbi:hypothetical protein L1987_70372 [Smallanthus sonchifolius]|uniref:Uncharacterized protein n=1 Tax=Smallanthus sonchifolius TaxID=185202 RepID=A0ACB9ANM8_9ASTR|nr:hypothetical protein L1987_70372 [Smallanthus sonchifolius]
MNKAGDLCNGCLSPILDDMPFYKCTYGCNFVLHEWCPWFPTELEGYENHPEHTLLLLPKDTYLPRVPYCNVCRGRCKGFAYSCEKCSYYVDVMCAFTPELITHKSHPQHLLSYVQNRMNKDYCRICLSGFTKEETSLSCKSCNFHLHRGCALFLPETVRHRYDKHPLSLTYSPVENHEGDYFCEVCEEELNPNACFYHCQECVQSMQTTCAPLIPQTKPYLFHGSSSQGDPDYACTYKISGHPHPLSYLQVTKTNDDCTKCGRRLHYDFILKCQECKFTVHSYHYEK